MDSSRPRHCSIGSTTVEGRRRAPAARPILRTDDFPVLSMGPTPQVDLATWRFTLSDGRRPKPLASWSWGEFEALPRTAWSRRYPLPVDQVVQIRHELGRCHHRRSARGQPVSQGARVRDPLALIVRRLFGTNVPVADLVGGRAMIATRYAARCCAAEHGGIPGHDCSSRTSYFWKTRRRGQGSPFHARRTRRASGSLRGYHLLWRSVARAALHEQIP